MANDARVHLEMPDDLGSFDRVNDEFLRLGWTDGLPIVPPTETKVADMLERVNARPDDELGLMPPRYGALTLERIAINAVMAGCLPEYMPVVVAAVKAMLDAPFNLNAVQNTTHGSASLVLVHGPIRRDLDINCGTGCLGPGWRANATIGRAVRLVMWNVGGGLPGVGDLSTFGTPAKYTYCFGENEEESPWDPFCVERGIPRGESAVTVFACEAPHNAMCRTPSTAVAVLDTIVDSLLPMGGHPMCFTAESAIVIAPEMAQLMAREGWTPGSIREYFFEHARQPVRHLKKGGGWPTSQWPSWIDHDDDDAMVPAAERPEDFLIVVAGGPGVHCLVLPPYGMSRSVTQRISNPAEGSLSRSSTS